MLHNLGVARRTNIADRAYVTIASTGYIRRKMSQIRHLAISGTSGHFSPCRGSFVDMSRTDSTGFAVRGVHSIQPVNLVTKIMFKVFSGNVLAQGCSAIDQPRTETDQEV